MYLVNWHNLYGGTHSERFSCKEVAIARGKSINKYRLHRGLTVIDRDGHTVLVTYN